MSDVITRYASHLMNAFHPDASRIALQAAAETLRPMQPDVIVVTGLSGIILGAQLATSMGARLTVVRRECELANKHGGGYLVEGHFGGRWVFFDDLVSSGETIKRALREYSKRCHIEHVTHAYLGAYLHFHTEWHPNYKQESLYVPPL